MSIKMNKRDDIVRAEPQQKDLVEEARAKLAKPNYGMGKRNRELMTQLCDEVERLREHVKDLNHDFDAAMKEADDAEETMLRKMYGR